MDFKSQFPQLVQKYAVFQEQYLLIENWKWLALFGIFLFTFFIRRILHFFLMRIFNIAAKTKTDWDDRLLETIEPYLNKACVGAFLYYTVPLVVLGGEVEKVFLFAFKVYIAYALIMMTYHSVDLWVEFFNKGLRRKNIHLDNQIIYFLTKTLKVLVVIFGILVMIQNLGVNIMSVLAGLGIGGLAFALAAQDTCANLFGSIMILLDKPFKIGDYIVVDGVEGSVEDIGFRSTKIRTFYNSQVIIPNAQLAKANVDNMGRRPYRRTLTSLGLEYSTSPEVMELFISSVKEILKAEPQVVNDTYQVAFESYGDFSLNVLLLYHADVVDYRDELEVRQRVYLAIYKMAEKIGAGFAFPTQTLHVHKN